MIPKTAYYRPEILDQELERLFSRGWQFAALSAELRNNHDFVCLDHPGAAVVVQNFGGELRAFQNICTHRFNRLQTEERGNRPLSCRYHGWSYNKEGCPKALPKRMQFDHAQKADLCLPAYEVELCGKFVFVRMGEGPSLREHLGAFYPVLEEISGYIGEEIEFTSLDHAANWKLLVENVLECYHCGVVHTETFVPFGIGKQPLSDVLFDGDHSSAHFPRDEMPREKLRQMYISHLKDRPFSHQSFYHIFIFPNLFIASTEGLAFYIGHAIPLGTAQTRLRMRLFEPAIELSPKHRARQEPINHDNITLSLKIVEEDRDILENIQRGIRLSNMPGSLGSEEVRIKAFWERYHERMDEAADAVPRGRSVISA